MKNRKDLENDLLSRQKNCLAQGHTGTNSKRFTQYPSSAPRFFTHGAGPYAYDLTGARYIDFVSGLGSCILGYAHPKVEEAVQAQSRQGSLFSLAHPLEIEVAEMIQSIIPAAQKIRFLKTGGEACSAAVRIARAATGRKVIFSQGYHGHGDLWTSLTEPALGVDGHFHIKKLEPYEIPKDADGVHPKEIAAIIVEALSLEMADKWQRYLSRLRDYCDQHGIVLIFDEVITGFRVPKWTASEYYSVKPDIIVLGKAIANGHPLAVVAGKKEIMDCGEYFISSTYSGELLSLAACKAVITEIQLRNKSFEDLLFYGKRLQDRLNMFDPEIIFEGYGTRAMLNITEPKTALFAQEAAKAGILFGKAHFFHFGHLEANLEEIVVNICKPLMNKIQNGEVRLDGDLPAQTFKR